MNIPLNGRIAIIDDKYEQAQPLMNALSRKKCPYLYFTGELVGLPEKGQAPNDIRILFLDINLIGEATYTTSQLKGILIGVLSRVISPANFPWVLIYWSRHEDEYDGLVKEIFEDSLKDRKPIVWISQNKLDFFSLAGEKTADFDQKMEGLFTEISGKLQEDPAYRQLIEWENLVHHSSDSTLKEIFSAVHEHASWRDNANYLMERLAKSYAGKIFEIQTPEEKAKSAFQTLNNVFADTLEYAVNTTSFSAAAELSYNPESTAKRSIYKINKKLLFSDDRTNPDYAGMVIEDTQSTSQNIYNMILKSCFNKGKLSEQEIKEFQSAWKKIHLVVTPLCDVVQEKAVNIKVIQGFLIPEDQVRYLNSKSEAIFVSTRFQVVNQVYILMLDYRYFYTATPADPNSKHFQEPDFIPLFRVRQSLLAEIQSRLARHLTRQGILFIDEQ
jgi:hypothetical protein